MAGRRNLLVSACVCKCACMGISMRAPVLDLDDRVSHQLARLSNGRQPKDFRSALSTICIMWKILLAYAPAYLLLDRL